MKIIKALFSKGSFPMIRLPSEEKKVDKQDFFLRFVPETHGIIMKNELMKNELIVEEIRKLKEEQNAIILSHFYTRREVQEVADFVGDSLSLCRAAVASKAELIVFAGVHFMAESVSILSPEKCVLLPVPDAGCPMAEMATVSALRAEKEKHPGAAVVCYVNSSAAVKAESDICCTSANAINVVNSLESREILFLPDKNLGAFVSHAYR